MFDTIENFMKLLSRYEFSHIGNFTILFWIISMAILIYCYKTSTMNINTGLLEDLGCILDDNQAEVRYFSNYIELRNLKAITLTGAFWRDRFEILNTIFSEKFIDVKINSKRKPSVHLYFDKLPTLLRFDEIPLLEKMETWAGKNQFGDDVKIDLQSTPAIYLDGKPGSGKTIALLALLMGFVKGIKSDVIVTIVTTKPADFFRLRKNKNIQMTIIDPFDGDFEVQVNKILKEFQEILNAENSFKEAFNENSNIDSSSMNLESLRQKGICEDVPRRFFIFDEAKDYLAKEKSDTKDKAQIRQSLISAVYTHIRRTSRFLSMPIIVASQTQNEGDLDIPIKMFHLRLASSTNEAMSRIICGDKRLTDLSFTKGKFFMKTDEKEHILRIPYIE